MAYGKKPDTNPLTGRRLKPKVTTSKTVGGRSKSTVMSSKMRPGASSKKFGRVSGTTNSLKAGEEIGKLGGAELGGGSLGASR